ncbi:MAG TPA: DNRLRE domain-containing protein [Planctomycetota bacterium]|nr:DNRLRE domain-containing protein [Planctomycetota bacterium]
MSGALACQTTVVVPCAADNTLYESLTGNLSNGAGAGVFAGVNGSNQKRRGLMRFDVAAAVPAGAKIVSATLEINIVMTAAALPIDVMVHRVLQSWGEGTSVATGGGGGGGAATTGDATWLHRFWPSTLWTTPGGDFAPAPSFTMSTAPMSLATGPAGPGSVVDAQFWLDNPAQNFGWLLKTSEALAFTARRIDSKESMGIPPNLTITYLMPGQLGTWGTGCPVGAGTFTFNYSGAPIGGTTIQLVQSAGPALGIGANFFSLGLDPVGATLLPSCKVYLPLAQEIIAGSVFFLDGAGGASSPFLVPAGFPGYLVVSQSVVLDNNPLGFLLSNAGLADLQ